MRQRTFSAAIVLAAGVLAVACSTPTSNMGTASTGAAPAGTQVSEATAASPASGFMPSATQWMIACQPDQQARITNTVRDGVQVSEVGCVDVPARADNTMPSRAASTRPVAVPVAHESADVISLDDQAAVQPRRTVRTTPAVYTVSDTPERPVRQAPARRSVKKSAVIIGASAGAGAGIGAILGGKKGALIGAAAGGGGAAIWDQVTRRK